MTTEQNLNIDPRRLFNLGANLVAAAFIKQDANEAKKLFKELKQGDAIKGGQLKSEKTGEVIPIKLELDRNEYRGQFNFPNFNVAVRSLLKKFETEVRKDKELKELRTLTNNENGEVLFNIPSGVQIDGDINVLMMAVKPESDCIIVRLVFMEPEPFLVETP
ncbi:MAG: hypothetical protein ACJ0QY_01445 [Porticoccaceae bacterium]|jgi:hypothetical protein|nr:hypothetical protein [Porticoccaceae bacterium]RPG82825.1 MAG: hypothetical protein CBC07_004660 [Cellvibrionales bacterium TMED47]CAI8320362.1 MAG: Uncharacterised protein [Cellvibrionales bacterium UBA7375]